MSYNCFGKRELTVCICKQLVPHVRFKSHVIHLVVCHVSVFFVCECVTTTTASIAKQFTISEFEQVCALLYGRLYDNAIVLKCAYVLYRNLVCD